MIKVATTPYSWEVLEPEWDRSYGDYYLYDLVLDEIKKAGYKGTELGEWDFLPTESVRLKDELVERDLTLVGATIEIPFAIENYHTGGLKYALKVADLLYSAGFPEALLIFSDVQHPSRLATVGDQSKGRGLRPDQWEMFSYGLAYIARFIFETYGIRSVFQPRCGTFVESSEEITFFLNRVDPELVGLCLDTGHLQMAGGNLTDFYKTYHERIWHIHFTDISTMVLETAKEENWDFEDMEEEGLFCQLGTGAVDFQTLILDLEDHNYQGWVVAEQDILPEYGTPFEQAQMNRAYLSAMGL